MKLCEPAGYPESKEAEYHTVSDAYDLLWYPECFTGRVHNFCLRDTAIAGSKSSAEGKQEKKKKEKTRKKKEKEEEKNEKRRRKKVLLRSGYVIKPHAAVLECFRGCVTVKDKGGNSHHHLAAARI